MNGAAGSDFKQRRAALGLTGGEVLSLHGVEAYPGGRGHVLVRCPTAGHEDRTPSCSVSLDTGHARCFGCGWTGDLVAIHRELGRFDSMGAALADLEARSHLPRPSPLTIRPAANRGGGGGGGGRPRGKPIEVARFLYHEADGSLAFDIRRIQFRAEDGSWVLKAGTSKPAKSYLPFGPSGESGIPARFGDDCLRPLYRLPSILAPEPERRVIVVEGEPAADVLQARGYLATTSSGGSSSAAATDWSPLAGRSVVIWPDNDAAGAKYAADVRRILTALDPPARCRVIDVSPLNLPDGGDAVDWFALNRSLRGDARLPAPTKYISEESHE